jgi:hypothetical protein
MLLNLIIGVLQFIFPYFILGRRYVSAGHANYGVLGVGEVDLLGNGTMSLLVRRGVIISYKVFKRKVDGAESTRG